MRHLCAFLDIAQLAPHLFFLCVSLLSTSGCSTLLGPPTMAQALQDESYSDEACQRTLASPSPIRTTFTAFESSKRRTCYEVQMYRAIEEGDDNKATSIYLRAVKDDDETQSTVNMTREIDQRTRAKRIRQREQARLEADEEKRRYESARERARLLQEAESSAIKFAMHSSNCVLYRARLTQEEIMSTAITAQVLPLIQELEKETYACDELPSLEAQWKTLKLTNTGHPLFARASAASEKVEACRVSYASSKTGCADLKRIRTLALEDIKDTLAEVGVHPKMKRSGKCGKNLSMTWTHWSTRELQSMVAQHGPDFADGMGFSRITFSNGKTSRYGRYDIDQSGWWLAQLEDHGQGPFLLNAPAHTGRVAYTLEQMNTPSMGDLQFRATEAGCASSSPRDSEL